MSAVRWALPLLVISMFTACARPMPDAAAYATTNFLFSNTGSRGCLSIDGRDPPAKLMSEIQKTRPHVFPAGKCVKEEMMYRTPTGERAQVIDIYAWRRLSPWHSRVNVHYDTNFMFGSGDSTLSLKRNGKTWTVSRESVDSIS